MDTAVLKKFAQAARKQLIEQVAIKLDYVLHTDSAELRGKEKALEDLKSLIRKTSEEAVVDKVAYIWFNRFCALRFMDVNRYTRMGILTPARDFTQPEILQEAKQGYFDAGIEKFVDKQQVLDLLSNKTAANDPQQEAYKLLLVATCNYYHEAMPFLFEKIEDYTELLMPDDLLSENSVLQAMREAIGTDSCEVETIGWLYQFYISEKKDQVFAALKKNKKVTPEDIPAATQLFTPHWIVRYLVENSLGRLWMLNHPASTLIEHMDYYIKPEQQETDFLQVSSPEELKVCDPACGSGHMLTYAFDLLYHIYEEQGYEAKEIPRLILENNLFGVEIDERAGELAAFALVMKACEKYKHFLRKPVQPQICVLENIHFTDDELNEYMDEVGRDLFTQPLQDTLIQFMDSDNFGSLICPALKDVVGVRTLLEEKGMVSNMFLHKTHQKVLQVLKQADYLSQKYQVVIANPPYMGGKGMNAALKTFAGQAYPNSKSDLFAMFIERNLKLAVKYGSVAMITMQSWMFLSSYEKLRSHILNDGTILSMAHLGARAFDSIGGEVVSTTAFVLSNHHNPEYKGAYLRLVDGMSEQEKSDMFKEAIKCQ
ncbi:MAG: BREX-1 system adenine-specific DNA-methyltransferase PglX [Mariprofundaceae bacterium]|nr:BREX-1 system adenine-specific DNA-methyltransferase PglX [Mariprofundaceae bacterium]